jgi:hypothetical protein
MYVWRKSSRSGESGDCVELGWRKSSRSGGTGQCVELAWSGAVRDSKNPGGPILGVDLRHLITAVKVGRFDI